MQLSKGQNAALPDAAADVTVTTEPPADLGGLALDLGALILNGQRQVLSDEHFVFYNQPSSPDGSVAVRKASDGSESVDIRTSSLPAHADTVVIVGSLSDQGGGAIPFSRVGPVRVHVAAKGTDAPLFTFQPDGLTTETALVFGEVYRRGGQWKFRAVGQGYDSGLAGIARDFGVDLEADPGPPPPASTAQVTSPLASSATSSPARSLQSAPVRAAPASAPPAQPTLAPHPPTTASGLPALGESSPPSDPTLLQAARVWNDALDSNERVMDLFYATFTTATQQLAAAEPSIHEPWRDADKAHSELRAALKETYAAEPGQAQDSDFVGDLDSWTVEVEGLAAEIRETKVPLRTVKRDAQKWGFTARAGRLLAGRRAAELQTLQKHHREAVRASDTAFHAALESQLLDLEAEIATRPALPAVVDSLELTDLIARPAVAGAGPLLVRVGSVTPGSAKVIGRAPVSEQHRVEQDSTRSLVIDQPWSVPVLLDLNLRAGIVTTDPRIVNNTLLRLLALLPAGQLKTTLFDPVKLGDSAKFIFGLGDAADAIIGDKVRSTDRELAEVLLGLEEHLTFVTQKYLQGQYDTLGDYNEAAGEVAEPYRALVLYDYPHGFVRPGGSVDEELMARLRKIVGSGQRCGVLTFVVRAAADFTSDDPASSLLPLFPSVPMDHWLARHLTSGVSGQQPPTHLKALVPGYLHQPLTTAAGSSNAGVLYSRQVEADWTYRPDPEPAPEVVNELLAGVERGLAQASDVRVSLAQVADLARAKQDRDLARGTGDTTVLPVPADPRTWWHASAAEGISATFGRVGAKDLATLDLDSKIAATALIGGRPGSGKSVLLHAMILSLVTRYSPDELHLYLVDFKEGVEFKAYATHALPHAKAVAVESDREFGLSVLSSLDDEIEKRGVLFRSSDGQDQNLSQYRQRTGQRLPRIVLLVDEFHALFAQDDKIAAEAASLLERVIKQGRAFGVHVVLASQTLAGIVALNKATFGLIPTRIALQSSDADSRMLLAEDNPDAQLLTRPGEGILNTKGGLKDGNARFQAAFTSTDERTHLLQQLRALADQRGMTAHPRVFEGREPADLSEAPLHELLPPASADTVHVPVGMALTLAPVVTAPLRREPHGNLLLVMSDDAAHGLLSVAAATLLRSSSMVHLVDYGPLDAPWDVQLSQLSAAGLQVHRRHAASAALATLSNLVRERQDLNDLTAPAHVLLVSSLHRARELDTNDDTPEAEHLSHILRDGPEVGVHVIAWCDKPVSVGRRLTSTMQRCFALRALGPMSKDDSFSLVDSDSAATLNQSQVVLDDHDVVSTHRARRFSLPDPAALAHLLGP